MPFILSEDIASGAVLNPRECRHVTDAAVGYASIGLFLANSLQLALFDEGTVSYIARVYDPNLFEAGFEKDPSDCCFTVNIPKDYYTADYYLQQDPTNRNNGLLWLASREIGRLIITQYKSWHKQFDEKLPGGMTYEESVNFGEKIAEEIPVWIQRLIVQNNYNLKLIDLAFKKYLDGNVIEVDLDIDGKTKLRADLALNILMANTLEGDLARAEQKGDTLELKVKKRVLLAVSKLYKKIMEMNSASQNGVFASNMTAYFTDSGQLVTTSRG